MNPLTVKNSVILDIDEFCKLNRINIPVKSEFHYYIETLRRSPEYLKTLSEEKIERFADFERWARTTEQGNIYKYKLHCLDVLKDYIVGTKAYQSMMNLELPKGAFVSRDHINADENNMHTMVSLDFTTANFSALKTFDADGELGDSWKELCNRMGIHEVLAESKSFRQLVFGNTNPKRLQTIQHSKIMVLLSFLQRAGINDSSIVFISHDELIFRVKDANSVAHLHEYILKAAEKEVGLPIKCSVFSNEKIKKNTFVKTVHSISPGYHPGANYIFVNEYKTLHGVPGSKFYMYFKKYVLNEPCEERDLMYFNDGELCKWIDESAPKKKSLPHYDKPDQVLSIKSAMTEYSYLWDSMTDVLPDMSNEEKRRVIEIVANSCKHCFQAESGCHCWNDD
jgi:hypothetical protein